MAVREKRGFEAVGKNTANRIKRMNLLKKRGQKIHAEFEAAILDSLMHIVLEKERG